MEPKRVNILGAWIDALRMAEAEERVGQFVRDGIPCWVVTLNPEMLYRAQKDSCFLKLINSASLVTADGVGILLAARLTGQLLPERVTGIDLLLRLVDRAAREGWRVFLLGGAPGVAEEAAGCLKRQFPKLFIAGVEHGFFRTADMRPEDEGKSRQAVARTQERNQSEEEIVELIRRARPHLLFVGMGAPKQEKFIARNLSKLGGCVAIGVGGSFDVLAGRVKRAPVWMRRLRLEWLGRLWQEPRRWRRVLTLFLFMGLVLLAAGHKKRSGG